MSLSASPCQPANAYLGWDLSFPTAVAAALPPPRSYYVVSWVPRALPEVVKLLKETSEDQERSLIEDHFELGMLVMRRCGTQNAEEIKCLLDGFREGTTRLSSKESIPPIINNKTSTSPRTEVTSGSLNSNQTQHSSSYTTCLPAVEKKKLLIFFNENRASRPWVLCPAKHCIKSARTTGKVKGRIKIFQYDHRSSTLRVPKLFLECLSDFLTRDQYAFATFCPQQKYTDHEMEWFDIISQKHSATSTLHKAAESYSLEPGGEIIFRELLEEHDSRGIRVWPFEDYIIFSNSHAKIVAVFKRKQQQSVLNAISSTANSEEWPPAASMGQSKSQQQLSKVAACVSDETPYGLGHNNDRIVATKLDPTSEDVSVTSTSTSTLPISPTNMKNDRKTFDRGHFSNHNKDFLSPHDNTTMKTTTPVMKLQEKKAKRLTVTRNNLLLSNGNDSDDGQQNDLAVGLLASTETSALCSPSLLSNASYDTPPPQCTTHNSNLLMSSDATLSYNKRSGYHFFSTHDSKYGDTDENSSNTSDETTTAATIGNDDDPLSSSSPSEKENDDKALNINGYRTEEDEDEENDSDYDNDIDLHENKRQTTYMISKANHAHANRFYSTESYQRPSLLGRCQPLESMQQRLLTPSCYQHHNQNVYLQHAEKSAELSMSSLVLPTNDNQDTTKKAEEVLVMVMTRVLSRLETTDEICAASVSVPSSNISPASTVLANSSPTIAPGTDIGHNTNSILRNTNKTKRNNNFVTSACKPVRDGTSNMTLNINNPCVNTITNDCQSVMFQSPYHHPYTKEVHKNDLLLHLATPTNKNTESYPAIYLSKNELNTTSTANSDTQSLRETRAAALTAALNNASCKDNASFKSSTNSTVNAVNIANTTADDVNASTTGSATSISTASLFSNKPSHYRDKELTSETGTEKNIEQTNNDNDTRNSISSLTSGIGGDVDAKRSTNMATKKTATASNYSPPSSAVLYHDLIRQFMSRLAFGLDHPPLPQKRIPDTVKRVVTKIVSDSIRDINLALLTSSIRCCQQQSSSSPGVSNSTKSFDAVSSFTKSFDAISGPLRTPMVEGSSSTIPAAALDGATNINNAPPSVGPTIDPMLGSQNSSHIFNALYQNQGYCNSLPSPTVAQISSKSSLLAANSAPFYVPFDHSSIASLNSPISPILTNQRSNLMNPLPTFSESAYSAQHIYNDFTDGNHQQLLSRNNSAAPFVACTLNTPSLTVSQLAGQHNIAALPTPPSGETTAMRTAAINNRCTSTFASHYDSLNALRLSGNCLVSDNRSSGEDNDQHQSTVADCFSSTYLNSDAHNTALNVLTVGTGSNRNQFYVSMIDSLSRESTTASGGEDEDIINDEPAQLSTGFRDCTNTPCSDALSSSTVPYQSDCTLDHTKAMEQQLSNTLLPIPIESRTPTDNLSTMSTEQLPEQPFFRSVFCEEQVIKGEPIISQSLQRNGVQMRFLNSYNKANSSIHCTHKNFVPTIVLPQSSSAVVISSLKEHQSANSNSELHITPRDSSNMYSLHFENGTSNDMVHKNGRHGQLANIEGRLKRSRIAAMLHSEASIFFQTPPLRHFRKRRN